MYKKNIIAQNVPYELKKKHRKFNSSFFALFARPGGPFVRESCVRRKILKCRSGVNTFSSHNKHKKYNTGKVINFFFLRKLIIPT